MRKYSLFICLSILDRIEVERRIPTTTKKLLMIVQVVFLLLIIVTIAVHAASVSQINKGLHMFIYPFFAPLSLFLHLFLNGDYNTLFTRILSTLFLNYFSAKKISFFLGGIVPRSFSESNYLFEQKFFLKLCIDYYQSFLFSFVFH